MNYSRNITALHEAILLSNSDGAGSYIRGTEFLSPEARLQIYIDGYKLRLATTLEADFKCFMHLAGEEYKTLFRSYIEATPPNHYSLDQYHIRFPRFIEALGSKRSLVDMATLESAIAEVFWLPDSEKFTPDEFKKITVGQFEKLKLQLCKASSLLGLMHDCEDYLQKFRSENKLSYKLKKNKNHILVYRNSNEVKRHRLTEPEYFILKELNNGSTVMEAIESSLNNKNFAANEIMQNLQDWFATWVKQGFFTAPS